MQSVNDSSSIILSLLSKLRQMILVNACKYILYSIQCCLLLPTPFILNPISVPEIKAYSSMCASATLTLLSSNDCDNPKPILNITQHPHLIDKTCQRTSLTTSVLRHTGIRVRNLRLHVQISGEIEISQTTTTYCPS